MTAFPSLSLTCNLYDHTQALLEDRIVPDGFTFRAERITDLSGAFARVVRDREFDVAELGFTFFARTMDFEDPPFYALPVFLVRKFQHSTTFIDRRSGIRTPADLAGRRVGEFATFGHDMGVWPKGIFSDDYNLKTSDISWVIGGVGHPLKPMDFIPPRHLPDTSVEAAPEGETLDALLQRGDLSALISALPPQDVTSSSSNIRRLFPDYETVEAAYYQRTGIFPIMHLVVVKREIIDQNPGLGRAILQTFEAAKEAAFTAHKSENNTGGQTPWFAQLLNTDGTLGDDGRWDYGVNANRKAVDTFLRYHFEQGLTDRQLTATDIFPPELLDT